jgi:hypothetical protein
MDPLSELVAKDEVRSAVHALFGATDDRDWSRALQCFAPAVRFDLGGAEAGRARRAQGIVSEGERNLAPLRAVHHQVGKGNQELEKG